MSIREAFFVAVLIAVLSAIFFLARWLRKRQDK